MFSHFFFKNLQIYLLPGNNFLCRVPRGAEVWPRLLQRPGLGSASWTVRTAAIRESATSSASGARPSRRCNHDGHQLITAVANSTADAALEENRKAADIPIGRTLPIWHRADAPSSESGLTTPRKDAILRSASVSTKRLRAWWRLENRVK